MKLHEPIGPLGWAAFCIRLSLGYYLLVQGMTHLGRIPEIVEKVKAFQMVPDHLAHLYGATLPFLAVACGIMLIVGFWTTLASIVSSLMIASVIYAFKDYPRGLSTPPTPTMLLFCSAVSLLFSGSGALSVDNFRKAEKK